MKSNAIIRIVLFSLAILIGVSLLLFALGAIRFPVQLKEYEKQTSSSWVNADDVVNIHIEWVAGSVNFKYANTNRISFEEVGNFPESEKMVWSKVDNTLNIRFSPRKNILSINLGFLSTTPVYEKDLNITLPTKWAGREVQVEAVSADIYANDLVCDILDVDAVSGNIYANHLRVKELAVDGVSGNINASGVFEKVDMDCVSGDCDLVVKNNAKQIDFDGVSGNLNITLVEPSGFACKVGAPLNVFRSEFETTCVDNFFTYGDAAIKIYVDGVSGTVNIKDGGSSQK